MPLPAAIDGVGPSRVQLGAGPWTSVLDALCARFPAVPREVWRDRFARGRVLGACGNALRADAPHRTGLDVRYFREVADEPPLPVQETVLHADEHLIVVDKPHFLPVVPAGRFVRETVLARLAQRFASNELAPLHRIDRLTAGLVMFSASPASRDAYQALFRERRITKVYEALAPALPGRAFPVQRSSRLEAGEPFFRMREGEGVANSLTRIEVLEQEGDLCRYVLQPITGRKHQLRVHMAALGAPILHDPLYPVLRDEAPDDPARPLKLLARSLEFVDPLSAQPRRFQSRLSL